MPSEEQLLVNAMDLFSAGSETTATTLAWAVRLIFAFLFETNICLIV